MGAFAGLYVLASLFGDIIMTFFKLVVLQLVLKAADMGSNVANVVGDRASFVKHGAMQAAEKAKQAAEKAKQAADKAVDAGKVRTSGSLFVARSVVTSQWERHREASSLTRRFAPHCSWRGRL